MAPPPSICKTPGTFRIVPGAFLVMGRLPFVQPLRHACGVPPLLVGEALAGRVTFYWTLEA